MTRPEDISLYRGWSLGCLVVLLLFFPVLPLLYFTGVISLANLKVVPDVTKVAVAKEDAARRADRTAAAADPAHGNAAGSADRAAPPGEGAQRGTADGSATEGGGAGTNDAVRPPSQRRGTRTAAAATPSPPAAEAPPQRRHFEPWTRYQIAEQRERVGRIVAGRRESLSYDVVIEPVRHTVPSEAQLRDIALRLRSDLHQQTLIYFYLPQMDRGGAAWATAHHLPGDRFEVRRRDIKEVDPTLSEPEPW